MSPPTTASGIGWSRLKLPSSQSSSLLEVSPRLVWVLSEDERDWIDVTFMNPQIHAFLSPLSLSLTLPPLGMD